MSHPTVTEQSFTIREGLTGAPGSTDRRRVIDAVMHGQVIVTAYESIAHLNATGSPQWRLTTYPDVAYFAGVPAPASLLCDADETVVHQWVSFAAGMYAKAFEAAAEQSESTTTNGG